MSRTMFAIKLKGPGDLGPFTFESIDELIKLIYDY